MKKTVNRLLAFILIIWIIGGINWALDYQLNHYGILPRSLTGLMGILATPFLHVGFYHLLNNSIGFVMLGGLISCSKNGQALLVKLTLFVAFWGGLLTWLFARSHFHVGLSGVIFGYWGFLTINGLFEKSIKSILLSFIAITFYGGMAFGVLPTSLDISFEGHIFGALSGAMYSYIYRRKMR